MKFLIGKKLEMTQIFQPDGAVVPVTKVQAGPCVVVQIKQADTDGYTAVQFGYGEKKIKNIAKPQLGRLRDLPKVKYLRELRVKNAVAPIPLKRGQIIDVASFVAGDIVDVIGTSKGRGFQGVVKRHGFHGMPATHGHKDQLRHSGSVGAKGPARVFKGTRMGGQMGNERVTTKNLAISKVDASNNILYIKGAVPGARNSLVIIKGEGEMQIVESQKSLKHESIKTLKQEGDKVEVINDNKDSYES